MLYDSAGRLKIHLPSGAQGAQGGQGAQGAQGSTGAAPSDIGCRVWNNANQSIADTTNVKLTFNQESYDTDTMHSTVSNTSRITITTAGRYLIWGSMVYASNATGVRVIKFWINNLADGFQYGFILNAAVNGSAHYMTSSFIKDLAANDYVEMIAVQTSGGALNSSTEGSSLPCFGARRLSS